MCDCRSELGSFPEVHLFLATSEEHAQGMQDLCDPCVKQEGSSKMSRTPFGGERVCGRISRGVTWDATRRRIGFYYRPETRDRTDSENALSNVDPVVARVKNEIEGVVGPGTDTS